MLRVAAHAKANVLLRVLARETSGYHALETVFTLLDLADELTVEPIPSGIELTVDGARRVVDFDEPEVGLAGPEVGPARRTASWRATI